MARFKGFLSILRLAGNAESVPNGSVLDFYIAIIVGMIYCSTTTHCPETNHGFC